MYRYVFANMYRQIQAKSKIVKMAWHIMACVIESKQICGFCGHKKNHGRRRKEQMEAAADVHEANRLQDPLKHG